MIKQVAIIVGCYVLVGALFVLATPSKSRPGIVFPDLGNEHILSIDAPHAPYNSVPPTSGPHLPRRTPWGVSTAQVPDPILVQNLEEGGVIVSYDPARVASSTVESLAMFMKQYPTFILMQPYTKPQLPSPIVLTAWTRFLGMDAFDEKKIKEFIDAYKGIDHHKKER